MTTELLPCPFCGSNYLRIAGNNGGDYYVICENPDESEYSCGAMTSPEHCETIEKAVRLWNKRAPITSQQRLEVADRGFRLGWSVAMTKPFDSAQGALAEASIRAELEAQANG